MTPFPKTLGACVDKLYKLREERLELQRAAEVLSSTESELREHIIQTFSKTDIEGAKGKVASCSLVRKTVATVEDWDKLYKYIQKNSAWDLLQRRVNDSAFRERLDAEEDVPGVVPFQTLTLSLTKVSR